ncbi:low specificity L-threonine aldolase [Bacteroides sp.]|uniref:threonine aldolase family protein n=1 Tax=Bacteroides sp. TaxID=29523 RepID=UPI001B644B6D|nr:low specificity L-threonine aldolase [Bacteroides sp.]MBP6065365.1 low specificity L-threonine aldolase [Bacteroides sp.]MBP6067553.1 low specificity L-threonine aldolase [Bacteroides sp.]MBP6936518.1 low specificity L-threonine aldolase [Bacteroides sp.]MBP8622690.1 low specificity L-threonine aldolase [Bacteroides sp.]MBP9587373.1 low specificity L-threonine aldolase [Bacteroides sp.]
MRSFASDNNSGVHPQVMEALNQANKDHALGYGDDRWTEEAIHKLRETFTPDCEPLFVFNGTGSNVVALQLITRPYHSILCAETAHIYVDECGSPVKMTGCQIRPIATTDGKLTPELIRPYLHGFGDHHHSQPGAIYLSQCTEFGTVYMPNELKAITELAHQHGMRVHMDGARIANACALLRLSLKELTVDCGIDILSFGGTKNGLMMGECVIVFDPSLKAEARFVRKQSAQLASKMRYLSCQFTAYLADELWLKNALHANAMADQLYEALKELPGVRFTQKVESNQLFLTMPRPQIDYLLQSYFFYFWNEEADEIRLVTSFDTTPEDVEAFLSLLRA